MRFNIFNYQWYSVFLYARLTAKSLWFSLLTWTMSREVALHIWPFVQKQPKRAHSAAVCIIDINEDNEKDCCKYNFIMKICHQILCNPTTVSSFTPLILKQQLVIQLLNYLKFKLNQRKKTGISFEIWMHQTTWLVTWKAYTFVKINIFKDDYWTFSTKFKRNWLQ